jgi:hypothetical protein
MINKKTVKRFKESFNKIDVFQTALIVIIFSIILLAFSLAQISPKSLKNFDQVCQKFNYAECMAVFWQQKSYYTKMAYISGGVVVVSLGVVIFSWLKKRK